MLERQRHPERPLGQNPTEPTATMQTINEPPTHIVNMGKLIVNLQSLEFALRSFLYNDTTGWKKGGEPTFLEDIKEGDLVPENAFTDYDSLGQLIAKYNKKVRAYDASLCVGEDLARIRDALAHGRIASKSSSMDVSCKLVKYGKPSRGRVKVTNCQTMTKEWFKEQIKLVFTNIQKVCKANNACER
jgi:hypothetical protein